MLDMGIMLSIIGTMMHRNKPDGTDTSEMPPGLPTEHVVAVQSFHLIHFYQE